MGSGHRLASANPPKPMALDFAHSFWGVGLRVWRLGFRVEGVNHSHPA